MMQIRHTDTLVYYEGVQVFEGTDEAGGRYIGVLADSLDGTDRYFVVEVSDELSRRFHGTPDLKALLFDASKDGRYLAEARGNFECPLVLQEQSGAMVHEEVTPEDEFVLGVLSYMFVKQNGHHVIVS